MKDSATKKHAFIFSCAIYLVMKSPGQRFPSIVWMVLALASVSRAGQKAESPPIHLVPCTIEKVSQCLAQEASSGYVAIHIAATVMDRPRSATGAGPGFGIWRSEDPVLITQKSDRPKRQTVAIIDDLVKREEQLNQAGISGMRLLPNEIAVLRSWAGAVSVDGYAALFEQVTPEAHFQYRVVDVADKEISEKLKRLLSQGFRSVAFVAPSVIIMERGSENSSRIDEYRVLQGFDAQHIGAELTRAATPGFRVVTAGVSPSGLLTTVLLEHLTDDKQIVDYQVFSGYNARDLEKKLNETGRQGYSPAAGGILPINMSKFGDRGMTSPPQRAELIVGKSAGRRYSDFKVLNAFGRDTQAKLGEALKDGYEFVEFVGMATDNLVILGRPAL